MSVDAELRTTQVDLSGLMKVMGRNLYSTPEVALRELVQNAHDSCVRRQIEDAHSFEPRIEVTVDPSRQVLCITDTGAGLIRSEVIEYLATVGRGYSGKMRAAGQGEGLIGAFGLGFLSAYFVSDRVTVQTTSYQSPDVGWQFRSRGGERYELSEIEPRAVGTRVELELSDDFAMLADAAITEDLLRRYCGLLSFPIHLGGGEPVNRPEPPWRIADLPPVRMRRLLLDFAQRFEPNFEPICALPVKGDDVVGVVWIQDGATYGSSDNRSVSVFVRGMMVSNDARDLLPRWAGFCGAVIESTGLTPTASRESLQKDAGYQAAADQLRESLIEGLAVIARTEPATWRRIIKRHNEALLGAAICDERLFALLAKDLTVPTTQGDLSIDAVIKRSRGTINVSAGSAGYEAQLFRALQIPLVDGTRYGALPFSLRAGEQRGAEVVQLGTHQADRTLFAPATTDEATAATLERLFSTEGRRLIPTKFKPTTLPLVLAPDREARLKARLENDAADQRISSTLLGLARQYTQKIEGGIDARLYINLDAPIIAALLTAEGPRQAQVGTTLRAFAELFAAGDPDATWDASVAFSDLTDALLDLLKD